MSLLVKVHQVVVLNISDHYTRNSLQNPQLPRRIVGILFGTQVGRTVNVIGSFEAKATINPSNNEIDDLDYNFAQKKMQLLKEANFYKECEFLGWYSICENMTPYTRDLKFHKGFYSHNENPIYLCFDPEKKIQGYDLPLKVYETRTALQDKSQVENLVEVNSEIDPVKAEIIGIEHLSKNMASAHTSLFADNMSSSVNALHILDEKIQVLLKAFDSKSKLDPEILRELKEVAINFPEKMKKSYREDLISEYKETSVINMLTAMIVANKTISDVTYLRPQFNVKTEKIYEDSQ